MEDRPRKVKFSKSKKPYKKYNVTFEYKNQHGSVDFGDVRYQHYRDATPLKLYKSQDHGDKERRRRYLVRARGIRDRQGRLTKDNPFSANYWAIRRLWP